MFKARTDEFKYLFILFDLIVSGFSFLIAFGFRFGIMDQSFEDLATIDINSYLFFGGLLAILQVVVFFTINLYDHRRFLAFFDEISAILGGILLTIFLSIGLLFFLKVNQISRILPLLYGVMNLLLIASGHAFVRRLVLQMRLKSKNLRNILIIGTNHVAQRVAESIERNQIYGLRVSGYILDGPISDSFKEEKNKIIGSLDDLEKFVENQRPYAIVFAGTLESHQRLQSIMDLCDQYGVHLQVVPTFSDLVTVNGRIESFEGVPIITIRDIPSRSGINRIVKRAFDIIFSLLFLIVFSPVYLVVALLVKLTSKGPIFFIQERLGLDHKVFKMLKFRTMTVQEQNQSDTKWTQKNDPRVTAVGKFLRKSSLDEIPQFFNVLAGQMSVVGPRPERPFYVEQFKDKYKYFMRRHNVKAGVTGWAQINGLRGDTSIQDRIEADIFYIENWSVLLDLKIVLLTPFKGLFSKNAY